MGNDSDSTLRVLVQLGVLGADDVAAAKQLIEETGKAGDESAKAMTQSMPENLAAWSKYKNVLRESGEGTGELHEKVHGLKILMQGAGPVAQEIGHLLHFAFNPAFLFGAGAAAAEESYFKWLEKREEKYKELISLAQKLNDATREIVNSGKTEDEQFLEFNKTLAEARANATGLAHDLANDKEFADRAGEAISASFDRAAALHQSTAQVQARIVDMLEAMGRLQPGEGDQLKLAIDHAAKMKALDDERGKAAADLSLKQTQYNIANSDIARHGDEASILRQKQQADFAAERNTAIINNYDKVKTAFDEADKAAMKTVNESTFDGDAQRKAWALHDSLVNQFAGQTQLYNQALGQNPSLEIQRAQAEKLWTDFQAAKGIVEGLKKELEDAKQKLSIVNADTAQKAGAENQSFGINASTGAFKGGGSINSILNDAINAMAALNTMKDHTGYTPADYLQRGTPQQKAYVQHLQQQVEAFKALELALGNNGDAAVRGVNELVKTVVQHGANQTTAFKAIKDGLQVQLDDHLKQIRALAIKK